MVVDSKTAKKRIKRAEIKKFKQRVKELEEIGAVVNAVFLQDEISSGRRTRKEILLFLLKYKQATLDKLKSEKVSELPDKLDEIVSAATKCSGAGGSCKNVDDVRNAIGHAQKLDLSNVKLETSDVDVSKLYEKLKTSYAFCLTAQSKALNVAVWLDKVIAKTITERSDMHQVQFTMDVNLSKLFGRPAEFTKKELDFLQKGNLKNIINISLFIAQTGKNLKVVALNTQLDSLEESLKLLADLISQEKLDSTGKQLQVLIEFGGVKKMPDDSLTPAFQNGLQNFTQFSQVLDLPFVQNVIYNETTSEKLKQLFPDVLQMGTQFKPFEPVMVSIENLNPSDYVNGLRVLLEAAHKEAQSVNGIRPFHDCMKTISKVPSDDAAVKAWKDNLKLIDQVGNGHYTFAIAFNAMKLKYTEFEKMQKDNDPDVAAKVYYNKLIKYPNLSKVKTELGEMNTVLNTTISANMTTWANAPKPVQTRNDIPNDTDIHASLNCLKSKDMTNNASKALKGVGTFPAITKLASANETVAEIKNDVGVASVLVAEIDKLEASSPAKSVKSANSSLSFDEKIIQQISKGAKVPADFIEAIEHEQDLSALSAHVDTLNPTQKKEFDPYWDSVRRTVVGAPKVGKSLIQNYYVATRTRIDEYHLDMNFSLNKTGLKSFNGAECMKRLHEIGAPLKDQEAEKRLRKVDLDFVNADKHVNAARNALGVAATYFLSVAPRAISDRVQAVITENKKKGINWPVIGYIAGAVVVVIVLAGVVFLVLKKKRKEKEEKDKREKEKKEIEEEEEFKNLPIKIVIVPDKPEERKIVPKDAQISKDQDTLREELYEVDGRIEFRQREVEKRTVVEFTRADLKKMTPKTKAGIKHSTKIMTEQEKIVKNYQVPAAESKPFNQTPRSANNFRRMAEEVHVNQYIECDAAMKTIAGQTDFVVGKGLDSYVKPKNGNTEASTRCNTATVSDDVVQELEKLRSDLQVDVTQEDTDERVKKVEGLLDKTQEFSERAHGGGDPKNKVKVDTKAAKRKDRAPNGKIKKYTELQTDQVTPERCWDSCMYFDQTTASDEDTAKGTKDSSNAWFPGAIAENGDIDIYKIAAGLTTKRFLEVEKFPLEKGNYACQYPLTAAQVIKIFDMAKLLHAEDAAFLELDRSKTMIVGDIHGKIRDFYYHYNVVFDNPEMMMLCLGDYVDRGDRGLCCLLSTAVMKIVNKTKFFFLSGNHEIGTSSITYGFAAECIRIFGEIWGRRVWVAAMHMCREMPVCAMLQRRVFCAHGGIVKKMEEGLEQFKQLVKKRPTTEEEAVIALSLRWADVCAETRYDAKQPADYQKGTRGKDAVNNFTAVAVRQVFQACGIKLIVRAHQVVDGVEPYAGTGCWTVFSSSNNIGRNSAAHIIFYSDNRVEITRFRNVKDPEGVEPPLTPFRRPPRPQAVQQVDETRGQQ